MTRPQTHLKAIAAALPEPDGTHIIRPLLEAGLAALAEKERAERIAARGTHLKLNPSVSDAGRCVRQTVYTLLNVEETNPPDFHSQIRFAIGHAYEEAMARILIAAQGASLVREERVSIPAGHTVITGRKDFDGVRLALGEWIVELKSTNARNMAFLLKSGPRSDNRKQLNLYLEAEQKANGLLVYLVQGATTGEPPLHAWIQEHDALMAADDSALLANADLMAKENTLPRVPEGFNPNALKFPCGWCAFRERCASDLLQSQLQASITQGVSI